MIQFDYCNEHGNYVLFFLFAPFSPFFLTFFDVLWAKSKAFVLMELFLLKKNHVFSLKKGVPVIKESEPCWNIQGLFNIRTIGIWTIEYNIYEQ